MKKIIAIVSAGFLFLSAPAQVNTAKLDSLFDILAANNKTSGSLAVCKNGKILYTRSVGNSVIDGNVKILANAGTRYRIGSITKMFTAVMIFQLIEEGKLGLETTLDKFYPAIPNAGKITIAHLLGHRSGIHNFTDNADYTSWMTQPKTHSEMLGIISAAKPDFEPGAKASYSNSNYVLLGYIIEQLTGRSYADNLAARITSKAGLANTAIGGKAASGKNESFSYYYSNGWQQQPETDMSIPGGAGSIVATPADLVKFIEALFAGKLVSAQSLSQMKNIKDGYGLGLFQFPFNEKRAYGHTGGIDGFSSVLAYFPGDSLAVAYTSNAEVFPTNDILIGVLSIYFGQPYTLPSFTKVNVSAADLEKLAGVYASAEIPLKIVITVKDGTLMAQATGQQAIPLEAIGSNRFQFLQAGIEMEFDPAKSQFTLKQGGGAFVFTKEK